MTVEGMVSSHSARGQADRAAQDVKNYTAKLEQLAERAFEVQQMHDEAHARFVEHDTEATRLEAIEAEYRADQEAAAESE